MPGQLHILGICGSLRVGSYNRSVLNAAVNLVPDTAMLTIYEHLADIPPFNQDQETAPPQVVSHLKSLIRASDAILFSTPEYNYSVPGVLKNAIDWASRPYGDSAWEGKPAAIMSAAGGQVGGARAQYHLRQIFVFLNMYPLNRPEVIIPTVAQKVDAQGNLTDPHTRDKITELLQALVDWTKSLEKEHHAPVPNRQENYPYEFAYSLTHDQDNPG